MSNKKNYPGKSGLTEKQDDLLALLLEDEGIDTGGQKQFLIEPDPAGRYLPFPLTDMQQAYLIGRDPRFDLGNVSSHAYFECNTAGLDPERYQLAWRRLIERHDMLRTLVYTDGYQQTLRDVPPFELKVLDLRDKTPEETEEALLAVREEMYHQILPSNRWPLFDVRFSLIDEDRVRLHFSIDGLTSDVLGLPIMMRDLRMFYEEPQLTLAPLEISFRDCVLALKKLEQTEDYRKAEAYWGERIPFLPPAPELPLTKNLSAITQPRFRRLQATLEADSWKYLKRRATRAGLTPTIVLLAAFAEVLKLWNRNQRFSLNLTLFNRPPFHPQINDIIGDFTSLLILAVDNTAQSTFMEGARHLQNQLWADMAHREFSGLKVMRELARSQSDNKRALMPVVFTSNFVIGDSSKEMTIDGRQMSTSYGISQTPQVLLDHQVIEQDGALGVIWDVVEEAFPVGLLDDMFAAYCGLVERLADDEAVWQERVPIRLPETQAQQRAAVNAAEAPVSSEMLHTLFGAQVCQRPEQPAVISSRRTLTYEEVRCRSNQVGRLLHEKEVEPNTLVAVVMEKGWEQVVAVLGILNSGAAYLPIDPKLPRERLWHLLENGEVRLVLTQSWVEEELEWPENVQRFSVDTMDLTDKDPDLIDPVQKPNDLAYVIYTSGSTGLPKGVMIDHRGAVNTILDVNKRFGVGPEDKVLALSNLNFDLSVYDIFGTLAAGGTIVLPDAGKTREPAHWSELMAQERVTIWNSVPALMQMLVEYASRGTEVVPQSLRLVLLSGDWIPLDLPDKIKTLVKDVQIISLGGATEASIWSNLYPVNKVDPNWKSIPYGCPMTNQRLCVLNESMDHCPNWVPGQLYIGGIGLAKGYWNDVEKTRNAFIVHSGTEERLYKTGDLSRYLPDGNIEFLGREDLQVKIRGYRIELGEIEAALKQHPFVRESVVVPTGKKREYQALSAYVIAEEGANASELFEIESVDTQESQLQWKTFVEVGWQEACTQASLEKMDVQSYSVFWEKLNNLYVNALCSALTRMGVYNTPGEKYDLESVMSKCNIVPRYRKWLHRGLKVLVEDGLLRQRDDMFESVTGLPMVISENLIAEIRPVLIKKLGYTEKQASMIFDTADNLEDVITESLHSAEIYGSAETPKVYEKLFSPNNAIISEIVRSVVKSIKLGEPLRILEVGAGVGATTTSVLPLLPSEYTSYFFTDISNYFIREAKKKFAAYPFISYGLLDLEKGAQVQGYELHSFNVIIASSVLHVPKNVKDTLHNIQSLLVPGGLLILVEETIFHRYFDLTMGLQQGFDRFEDVELRPDHPLLSRKQWQNILINSGFETCEVINQPHSLSDFLGSDVIVAQGQSSVKRFDSNALRSFVRKILPEYMVPSSYILVDTLPLAPNGKVDRQALRDTYGEQIIPNKESGYVAPRNEFERNIAEIWKDVLDVDRIGINDNFFELGGDSLLVTTLVSRIMAEFGESEDPTSIWKSVYELPTIANLVDNMRNEKEMESKSNIPTQDESPIMVLKPEGTSTPFFCIHSGSGNLYAYRHLSKYFDPQRPLYGIQLNDPDSFIKQAPHRAIKRLASQHIRTIQTVQAEGPYLLCGHCVGGVIAFEMAQQLLARGQDVEQLFIISSYVPPCLIEDDVFLLYMFAGILGVDRKQLGFDFEESEFNDAVHIILKSNPEKIDKHSFYELSNDNKFSSFVYNYRKAQEMHSNKTLTEEMFFHKALTTNTNHILSTTDKSIDYIENFYKMQKASLVALTRYELHPYPDSVVLFRTTDTDQYFLPNIKDKIASLWRNVAPQGFKECEVPGTHWTCLEEPNVRVLAEKINMILTET